MPDKDRNVQPTRAEKEAKIKYENEKKETPEENMHTDPVPVDEIKREEEEQRDGRKTKKNSRSDKL